jgi:hypothetical protein
VPDREASPVTIGSQEFRLRPPRLSGSTIVAAKYVGSDDVSALYKRKYSGGLSSLTTFRSAFSALRLKGGAPKKREAKSPRSPGKKRAAAGRLLPRQDHVFHLSFEHAFP